MNEVKAIVIILVGLPARGKSYISRKINRFLEWNNFESKIFNIGNYRRKLCGPNKDANFFLPYNQNYNDVLETCAIQALSDLAKFLNLNKNEIVTGQSEEVIKRIGILDGTNITFNRRKLISDFLQDKLVVNYSIFWIETIVNLDIIIEKNLNNTKLFCPDYREWDPEKAYSDYKKRIDQYNKLYQTIDPELEQNSAVSRYIKIINEGQKIIMNNVHGYIESLLVSYIVNLHSSNRVIYFSRHGQSVFNTLDKIGGDSDLSEKGILYAEGLAKFFNNEFADKDTKVNPPKLYCSTLKRTIHTSSIICRDTQIFEGFISDKSIDEINSGDYDGMSYNEFKKKFPDQYDERSREKLNYRYPRGESYLDVIRRVRPFMFEIERTNSPMIIICHQGTLRCLYGYFTNQPIEKIPTMEIPLHVVIKYIPKDYGFIEERFEIDPDSHKAQLISRIEKFTDHFEPEK